MLAEGLGEAAHLVGIGARLDGHEDVKPLFPGCLGIGHQLQRTQCFLEPDPGAGGVGEFPRVGIEVEADPVGRPRVLLAGSPDVDRDAAQVDQSELRDELPADNVVGGPLLVPDRLGRGIRGHARRFLLLVEALPRHSIGTALSDNNRSFT